MKDISRDLTRRLLSDRKLTQLIVVALIVFLAFSILVPDLFLTPRNFVSMAFQIPEIALLALGVMLAMLTAGIDLSVVSMSNLAALSTAYLLVTQVTDGGGNVYLWIVIAIVIGIVVGLISGLANGAIIAGVGVTPILATLATLTLYNGIAVGIRNGQSIIGLPPEFTAIGNGSFLGIPIPMIILLVAGVGVALYINKTGLGMQSVLVGANQEAATYSAIGVKKVLLMTYTLSGGLSALAGLIIASRSASANPDYGSSYVLLAIVIVVLGGVNPYGGFGTVTGVILATAVLQMVSSGFNALRFSQFFYQLAQGFVLIAVMILNTYVDKRRMRAKKDKAPKES
ncbi:ABC transporter permease [Pontimonas sp.]|nr:ABC transporter permease [Microbacteriaceae bacterium]MDA9786698.1 ABC transporter permease [Pontimonas sp.]